MLDRGYSWILAVESDLAQTEPQIIFNSVCCFNKFFFQIEKKRIALSFLRTSKSYGENTGTILGSTGLARGIKTLQIYYRSYNQLYWAQIFKFTGHMLKETEYNRLRVVKSLASKHHPDRGFKQQRDSDQQHRARDLGASQNLKIKLPS